MNARKALQRFLAALLTAALLMSAGAPAALAAVKAKVFINTKVYSVPSTSGKSVRVSKGLQVKVAAVSGDWAKIKYNGKTAYIPYAYLNLVDRLTAYTAKSTAVYKLPSTSSSKMGTLSIATAVYVVGKVGSFYRVQNSSGSVTGYVKGDNLTTKAKLLAAYNAYKKAQAEKKRKNSGGDSASELLLALLKSLVGKPYADSAYPPSSFNCSALVWYVMDKFGIPMYDTAEKQANDGRYAKITDVSKLRLGDVLCFDEDKNGKCDHSGIYVGSGRMVDASRNAGQVQLTELNSWYAEHFMWARRPG